MKTSTLQVRIYDEVVTLSEDTINKTWDWYIANALGCIEEVLFRGVYCNDTPKYINDKLNQMEAYRKREVEPWLGFIQTAYYIQSGECVGILG